MLQTSRYVTGDVPAARAAVSGDAEVLRRAGLTVIREKVEAVATDEGVPRSDDDATRSPADRYFEFHVLVDGTEQPLTEDDMRSLRTFAAGLSTRLGRPVPLSYNAMKPSQRFLNLRARGVGLARAMVDVNALVAAISSLPDRRLTVTKTIAEYICFDSNRAVDDGWLEPL